MPREKYVTLRVSESGSSKPGAWRGTEELNEYHIMLHSVLTFINSF